MVRYKKAPIGGRQHAWKRIALIPPPYCFFASIPPHFLYPTSDSSKSRLGYVTYCYLLFSTEGRTMNIHVKARSKRLIISIQPDYLLNNITTFLNKFFHKRNIKTISFTITRMLEEPISYVIHIYYKRCIMYDFMYNKIRSYIFEKLWKLTSHLINVCISYNHHWNGVKSYIYFRLALTFI